MIITHMCLQYNLNEEEKNYYNSASIARQTKTLQSVVAKPAKMSKKSDKNGQP